MNFIITAGGTREYLDPVRFISNASTGRMGYALAAAALEAGHKVILITAPTELERPAGAEVIEVVSAEDMLVMVKDLINEADCLIMAAAVADFTPAYPVKSKIKKSGKGLTIKLKPTDDIVKWAGRHKQGGQMVVGFALEDSDLLERAQKKMRDKRMDMIVANEPVSIGADTSTVHIMTTKSGRWKKIANKTKLEIAKVIINQIDEIY